MKKTSEQDLLAACIVIDPKDSHQAISISNLADRMPDESWNTETLEAYAAHHIAEFIGLQRRSAIHLYRAGLALLLIRDRLKGERQWCSWQDQHEIARTTAWEAVKLAEFFHFEDELAELGIIEAKRKANIVEERSARVDRDRTNSQDLDPRSGPDLRIVGKKPPASRRPADNVRWHDNPFKDGEAGSRSENVDEEDDDHEDMGPDLIPIKEPEDILVRLRQVAEVMDIILEEAPEMDLPTIPDTERQQLVELLDEITGLAKAIRSEVEGE